MTFKATTILIAALLALPALPASARDETLSAAGAAGEPIPVADPALLQRMGYSADATHVYVTEGALLSIRMTPAERARAEAAAPEAVRAGGPTSAYGTASRGYSPVLFTAFYPRSNSGEIAVDVGTWSSTSVSRYCFQGNPIYEAQIDGLPHGARLENVWLMLFDNSNEDIDAFLVRYCRIGDAGVTEVVLASRSTSGQPGAVRRAISFGCEGQFCGPIDLDETVDLESCAYSLRIRLDDDNSCSEGAGLTIHKAVAYWHRQVSPAPDTATFDDVPTGHPFFQHVEALAASGITSGCDADSFCPGDSLTRGQMAVFLAKALGLHWTDISQ